MPAGTLGAILSLLLGCLFLRSTSCPGRVLDTFSKGFSSPINKYPHVLSSGGIVLWSLPLVNGPE